MPSCYLCGTWIQRGGGVRADLVTGSSFSSRGNSRFYISRKSICTDCARKRRRNHRIYQHFIFLVVLGIFSLFVFSENEDLDSSQGINKSSLEQSGLPQDSCGDQSSDVNQRWYGVILEDSDLENTKNNLCRDAYYRQLNGRQVIQGASFVDAERARKFAEEINGQVVTP